MTHSEFIREQPGSSTAVLFIHGILGTPNHFKDLIPIVPDEWSVYNILLDGHGKTVDDFAASNMEIWTKQVHGLIENLSDRYENLVVVAHSMGTLFALHEALDNRRIRRLFLLDVPLRVTLKSRVVVNSWNVIFDKIDPDDVIGVATQDAYSITPDRHLWKYLKWIPNYLALFAKIRSTRKKVAQIQIPCMVFQSGKDELVAVSAVKYLKENAWIKCRILPHSGHFYYEKSDAEIMQRAFRRFCSQLSTVTGGDYGKD